MNVRGTVDVLTQAEKEQIHAAALTLLEDIGYRVQNHDLLDVLAAFGARVDMTNQTARFPQRLMERFVADAAGAETAYEEGMECSCLFPDPTRPARCHGVEATAGTYPQHWMDLDGTVAEHTRESVALATRLADALPSYDRLGVMGVPRDVPQLLGPLHMRLLAWTHAERKLSGCGEVRDTRLIPYVFEMGRLIADARQEPARRYSFAEVELVAPWQFTGPEAEIFVRFWKEGLLAGIGSMFSAGGSAPVTPAAVLAMMVAESLFISVLYRECYGWKRIYLQSNSSVMDMRSGMFPFGRPERGLLNLAMGSLARYYRADLWASAIGVDAKTPGYEAAAQCLYTVLPSVMAGTLGLECFGILSGGEMNSALQLVLDDEMLSGVKRMTRGFAVNDESLALDTIREVGIGGLFTAADHTLEHFRESWEPTIFSREPYNAWLASGRKTDLARAREKAERILAEHDPHPLDESTERALAAVIARAEKDLL